MIEAVFMERKNRFVARVLLGDEVVEAHVANSGRLKELFKPGHQVYLVERSDFNRTTKYDLALVKYQGRFVSVDARIPNKVVSEAINSGQLLEFDGYKVLKREVKYGNSRLDMVLADELNNRFYVEVKSCTLVTDKIARFPDAPTERGARHLEELLRAIGEGYHAAVIFLVQRDDAVSFSPNDNTDPGFSAKLREVVSKGVKAYAYICKISCEDIKIVKPIPILL